MTQHILILNSYLTKPIAEVLFTIGSFFNKIYNSYRKTQIYKQTIKELSGLTDRDLLDMGISRYDIEEIARQVSK